MEKNWMKKEFGAQSGIKDFQAIPEIAERWYSLSKSSNRPLSERKILLYQKAMLDGQWTPSPDCILFFEDGGLGNGQHRLLALGGLRPFSPDLIIPLSVKWGVPRKIGKNIFTMAFIDRGRLRKTSHNWMLAFNKKGSQHHIDRVTSVINIFGKVFFHRSSMEPYELEIVYKAYRDPINLVFENEKEKSKLSVAPVSAALVFAAAIYPDKVREFQERFYEGDSIPIGNPILTLRNRLLNLAGYTVRGGTSMFKECLGALKYFVEGEELKKIYLNDHGLNFFLSAQQEIIKKLQEALKTPDLEQGEWSDGQNK